MNVARATRQRFTLGRPCLAETFLPNWRQNSGESSTLLYPPARECEDVKVSSQTRLFGRHLGDCKATFTIPVPLVAGERDFLRGQADNNTGISPGDGIYANQPLHTSHTRQTSAITSGSSRGLLDLSFYAATKPGDVGPNSAKRIGG